MATKKAAGSSAKPAAKTATAAKSATKPASKGAAAKKPVAAEQLVAQSHAAGKKAPTHEEISELAHRYWEERGHRHGSHEADWHRAEQELRSRS